MLLSGAPGSGGRTHGDVIAARGKTYSLVA